MIDYLTNGRHFLVVCLTGLIATQALGQQSAASRDHPLLAGFPDSEIISLEFEEDAIYRLVLSGLQRTRGLVTSEVSERLRGDVTKIVYEVSQEFTGGDVYQFFREQLANRGYTELFTCSGRACGSSNYWANDIFRNRILHGPERNQYYLAMQVGNDLEESPSIAVYIITRGNRRIYAYLEIVETGGSEVRLELPDDSELGTELQENGALLLSALTFAANDELTNDTGLQAIVDLLQADPALSLYVVAHLAGSEALPSLLARSQRRADSVRERLIGLGIAEGRLVARGVGPLAPICAADNCTERVELVLR